MTRYIGTAFKDLIKRSHYTYAAFAEEVGFAGRQVVNHYVNHKLDCDWKYDDISLWCRTLGVDFKHFLEDVDRKRQNA